MRIIVGLGNPGREYEGTRHNVGFEVIDLLARKWNVSNFQLRMEGLVSEVADGIRKILLVKPQTFMNLSGRCVSKIVNFYKVPLESLMVVCDDKEIDLGRLRIRSSGSHGGNNGLRNIQEHLGIVYPRIRIGIGKPAHGDASSHVLGKFTQSERDILGVSLSNSVDAIETWLKDGLESCMNKFNGPGTIGR